MPLSPAEAARLRPLARGAGILGVVSLFTFCATSLAVMPPGAGPITLLIMGLCAIDALSEEDTSRLTRKTWISFLSAAVLMPFVVGHPVPVAAAFLLVLPSTGMALAWLRLAAGKGWMTAGASRGILSLMDTRDRGDRDFS